MSLFKEKKININEENMSNLHIVDTHPFKTMINFDEDIVVDDVIAIWEDHNEGIYICQSITLCMNYIFLYKFMCFVK